MDAPNDPQVEVEGPAERQVRQREERVQLPKIEVKYVPEEWKVLYKEQHTEKFNASVEFLQTMMGINREEAEETLLDILTKTTFIEINLMVNGAQDAEKLFGNLLEAKNEELGIPFSSQQEVADFCDGMSLIFRKESNEYRNAGVQGRRLVQELKKRLRGGDSIDEDNIHQVLEEFCENIEVDERLKNFAQQEAGLDYPSLRDISKTIPEFNYDKTTGRLGLSPDADKSLMLNAPIFTDTIHSSHEKKLDRSRTISALAIYSKTTYPDCQRFFTDDEKIRGVEARMFWKRPRQDGNMPQNGNGPQNVNRPKARNPPGKTAAMDSMTTVIHGCISPNHPMMQIEVFGIEPLPISFADNLCTGSAAKLLRGNEDWMPANFGSVENYLDARKSMSFEKDIMELKR
ncbi:unnamed protein product [Caenorhabditis nigoni]